jgi:hypothetical protein
MCNLLPFLAHVSPKDQAFVYMFASGTCPTPFHLWACMMQKFPVQRPNSPCL